MDQNEQVIFKVWVVKEDVNWNELEIHHVFRCMKRKKELGRESCVISRVYMKTG